jgi:DNA-binding transcriptional LysR family regulator
MSPEESQVRHDGALAVEPLSGRDLAAFVAAVETGTVQGAADALTLTQSAVSKRIQALERRLGARLLDRGRHGASPTETGQRLYPQARYALVALARAEEAARPPTGAQRLLSIAASHTVGEVLLPGWLAAYRVVDLDLQVQVDIDNSPTVIRHVLDGTVDLGFVEGIDPLRRLETMVVARDELVAVVGSQHRWARRRSIRARELADEPYITREAGSGTRAVVEAALGRAGVRLRPTLEVASLQSVKRALAGGGVSLISAMIVADEQRSGSLHALRVHDVDLTRELRAVRRRRPAPTASARRFWSWLEPTGIAGSGAIEHGRTGAIGPPVVG